MNTCNSANSVKLGKLLKRFKLTPKNKQKIIQEAQKDYSTWSGLKRFGLNLIIKKVNWNYLLNAIKVNSNYNSILSAIIFY